MKNEPPLLRRQRILELLSVDEFLRPADLADSLGVSGETVRRDLQLLADQGLINRMHGGVAREGVLKSVEPDRSRRSKSNVQQKREIAKIAAGLMSRRSTAFFDVGTTVEALTKELSEDFSGTVITNSLVTGSALARFAQSKIHVLGGQLRHEELTTFGLETVNQIENFNADVAFVSAGGIDPVAGLTDYFAEDIPSRIRMISQAQKSYVLATSDKLGVKAPLRVSGLDGIHGIITDAQISRALKEQFRDYGVEVLHP